MHHKKRVLILSPQPFFIPRGTPINVREILLSLSEAGHEITLLAYPFGEDLEIKYVQILRSPNFPFIKSVKAGPSVAKIFLDILFFFKALILILTKSFDVIHGIEEGGLMAGIFGLVLKKPYIFDVDSSMSSQLQESGFINSRLILNAFEKVEAFFIGNSAGVITVCTALSDDVKRICPSAKITQIEDFPMDEEVSSDLPELNLRSTYNIPDHDKIILYAGNLETYQGIDLLLNAYHKSRIDSKDHLSKLVIVGGSKSDIEKYTQLSQSLNLESHVIFTGILAPELMSSILIQADVLTSPRISGTNTPLKIYGYMNSEKPILATRILSHTQVLDDNNSYLGDSTVESYSAAMLKAISSDSSVITKNAKDLIDNKYSRKRFRAEIKHVYQDILGS